MTYEEAILNGQRLREQYGEAVKRLTQIMIDLARGYYDPGSYGLSEFDLFDVGDKPTDDGDGE